MAATDVYEACSEQWSQRRNGPVYKNGKSEICFMVQLTAYVTMLQNSRMCRFTVPDICGKCSVEQQRSRITENFI
jgi:hypothetical protein